MGSTCGLETLKPPPGPQLAHCGLLSAATGHSRHRLLGNYQQLMSAKRSFNNLAHSDSH